MDFTQPPLLVDGIFSRVFVDRDLASGETLAARATMGESSSEVVSILEELFRAHGAPLDCAGNPADRPRRRAGALAAPPR